MSKKMSRYPSERKVYVGDLGSNARKDDIEYAFSEYGPICSVWVARNPPGFAFVEFEDARDAADAVRKLSGRSLFGRRIRVELSTVGRRNERNKRSGRYDEGNLEEKCFDCGVRGHYARECRRYVRARRRNDEVNSRRSPSASRGRRTPSPRATRSRSRSGSRHRNSPTSTTHNRRDRHERRKKDTKQSRERDVKRSRERESRYSDEEKKHEYRKNGRRPPSPDAPKKRGYDSRSQSGKNSSDSRSRSDSDNGSRRSRDDSSASYSPRSSSRKN